MSSWSVRCRSAGKPGSKEVWDYANAEQNSCRSLIRDVTMPNGAVIKKGALTGIHKECDGLRRFTDP